MSKTVQQDHREAQARTAGEEARDRIMALSVERGGVFLDQISGKEGADEEAERLDAEIAELERRARLADDAALEARRHDDAPVFGLVLTDAAALLVADPVALERRLRHAPMSRAVRSLDLAALHTVVLADRLGIGPEEVAAGDRLAYTRSEADARERVARGEAAAAILVRPTRLDQLAEVASAGDVMPQKSTYFYPKLLTGMVFNPLED